MQIQNNKIKNEEWSLDDELDLFSDTDWKFIDTTITDNIEYYNDIRDTQFDGNNTNDDSMRRFIAISLFSFAFIVLCMLGIQWSGVLNNRGDYERVNNIQSVNSTEVKTSEREGDTVNDSEILISADKTLTNYFTSLGTSSFTELNDFCVHSSLADMYKDRKDNIKTTYDVNDCYARLLKTLALQSRKGRINEIRRVDNKYLVYMNIALPTEADVSDFVYNNKYNLVKQFNTAELSTENIIQYILKLFEISKIGTTSAEYCIELNEDFKIIDDSLLCDVYTNTYKDLLENIVQIVGGDLQNIEY